ncbi:MAG: RICIN domain-containing protein, partial [Clostridium perfringens]|nr:RICIN domain-containing protein [Clostridium perfringens]
NITIWDDANVSQQRWRFKYDSSKNAYAIISSYSDSGLMWNVSNFSSNVIAAGQGYTNSQLWVLEDVGNGYYIFKSYHNQDMVLDLYKSDIRNASNIQVHLRHNGDNQKFKLIR